MPVARRWKQAGQALAGAVGLMGLLVLIPHPAYPFLGFDIVTDIETEVELGTLISSAADQLQQTINLYRQTTAIYGQATAAAQFLKGGWKGRMLALTPQPVNNLTHNRYGENANWAGALNGNPGQAGTAWNEGLTPLNSAVDYSAIRSQPQLRNQVGLLEKRDGFGTECLQALASYRQATNDNQRPLNQFDATVVDETDGTNSEVQQLNEANVGAANTRKELQAQGQLKACEVQAQLLDQSEKREREARRLNYLAAVEQGRETGRGKLGHMGDTLNSVLLH